MKSTPITPTIKLMHNMNIPQEPWAFVAKLIEQQADRQISSLTNTNIGVLYNKGKYFEMSIYKRDLLVSMSKAIKVKITHNNMLVANWTKLEALVKAFNKRGYYVNITVDWI